jgi:uncharacterized protein (TIGR02001 family)
MTVIGFTAAGWRRGLALLTALLCAPASAQRIGGDFGVATDNVFRGVSRSAGEPSAQLDLHDAYEGGYFGVSAESIRRGRDEHTALELLLYAAYRPLITDAWTGTLEVRRYQHPGEPGREQFNYDELALILDWRARLTATVVLSTDTYAFTSYQGQIRTGSGSAYDYALLWRQPLPAGFAAAAGLGYYDLRGAVGAGYAYGDVGVSYARGRWSLDLRYIGTSEGARELFGNLAGERLVAAAVWSY